ncbi:MAG: hypothetical protein AAF467_01800 [Actinomycetota bacterium]
MDAFIGLYRLLLRQQLSAARLALAGALGALAILVAFLIARDDSPGVVQDMVGFLSVYGLGLTVPILCLVMASSTFGHLVDDETLVYIWIRPVSRWIVALAGWLASATVAVPATVIPLTIAAALGTANSEFNMRTIGATALAMALGAVAYTGLFTFFGLLVRRALIWGLLYVFVWEVTVSRLFAGAARVSINTYPASVLSDITNVGLPLAESSLSVGIIVPLVVTATAVALTAWRLNTTDVA